METSELVDLSPAWYWYAVVLIIGAAGGAVELIGRYRDAPFRVLLAPSAAVYIAVNAFVALMAYVMIVVFDWKFDLPDGAGHRELVRVLVAGFGAMVFFRSSLFSVRIGQTDVAVGPAVLFQVLLFATDRQCDRQRAEPRSALVAEIMRGVDFEKAREALPNYCFELMQNVATNEQNQFTLVVKALSSSTARNDIKSLTLGLMLMNVVGSQVLRVAVKALGPRIQGPAQLELLTLGQLQAADFNKAYPLLADVCFIMATNGTDEEQKKSRAEVLAKIKDATDDTALDNSSKMTLFGLLLQQYVGDGVLEAALTSVRDAIALQKAPAVQPEAAAPEAAAPEAAAPEAAASEAATPEAAASEAATPEAAAPEAAVPEEAPKANVTPGDGANGAADPGKASFVLEPTQPQPSVLAPDQAKDQPTKDPKNG